MRKPDPTLRRRDMLSVNRPLTSPDFIATLCTALGIDVHREFLGPESRPAA